MSSQVANSASIVVLSALLLRANAEVTVGCEFESYPSPLGNPDPTFDGSFESGRPWAQSGLGDFGAGSISFGCICRRNHKGELQDGPLDSSTIPLFANMNDAACNVSCIEAAEKFDYSPGSDSSFTMPKIIDSVSSIAGQYRILGETVTAARPNLRFNLAYEGTKGVSGANFRVDITLFEINVNPNVSAGEAEIKASTVVLADLDETFFNATDCSEKNSKWAQVTVSFEPLLTSQEFEDFGNSLKLSFTRIFYQGTVELSWAIDNVEFIGPPLANQTLVDKLSGPELEGELPKFSVSVLGDGPFDVFVSVMALLFLFLALFGVIFISRRQDGRANILSEYFAISWMVISTLIALYAIVQYFSFLDEARVLEARSKSLAAEVTELIRTPGFDPRNLEVVTAGASVYGAFILPIPRFDRSTLERVFSFEDGLAEKCLQTRISDGDCFDSVDAYFDFLNTTGTIGVSLSSSVFESSVVEGTASPTQEHFLDLLLASLLLDIVVSAVLVAGAGFQSRCSGKRSLKLF